MSMKSAETVKLPRDSKGRTYDDWASQQCMGPMLSCDRCGKAFPEINGPYQYCPYCGARVVSDD